MNKWIYRGHSVMCLPLATGDVVLAPGRVVELPDNDVAATLAAKGLLEPVAEDGAPAAQKTRKK